MAPNGAIFFGKDFKNARKKMLVIRMLVDPRPIRIKLLKHELIKSIKHWEPINHKRGSIGWQ